ncbi:MAG TPA: hypothetical protein VJ697_16955, partial [Nitrososphaeraceae archaeon]|nr:hypothetical protein [Nitrososphaeraceae archaeon]
MSDLYFEEFEEKVDELSELKNVKFPNNSFLIEDAVNDENSNLYKLYNALKEYLNNYDNKDDRKKNPKDLAAIHGLVQYAFQNKGILPNKIYAQYKIKSLGKDTTTIVVFNKEKYAKKLLKTKDVIDEEIKQALPFNLEGLPPIAHLLANGILLTEKTIKIRTDWLDNMKGYSFPEKPELIQETNSELQMKRLLKHLIYFRKAQYEADWQKVTRCFLTGLIMDQHYASLMKKVNSKKQIKAPKVSLYVDTQNSIVSKCSSILKKENMLDTIHSELVNQYGLLDTDHNYNLIESKKKLLKDLKSDLKLSYLLYQFVKMFGYIALVASPMATSDYLLQKLNFKGLEEMSKSFKILYEDSEFGGGIIKANHEHGSSICDVVIKYAEYTNISHNILKKHLEQMNKSYSFLKFYEHCYKVSDYWSKQGINDHYYDQRNYRTANKRRRNEEYNPDVETIHQLRNVRKRLQDLQNPDTFDNSNKQFDFSKIININPFNNQLNNQNQITYNHQIPNKFASNKENIPDQITKNKQLNQMHNKEPFKNVDFNIDQQYYNTDQYSPNDLDKAIIPIKETNDDEIYNIVVKEANRSITEAENEQNFAVPSTSNFLLKPLNLSGGNSKELTLPDNLRKDMNDEIRIVESALNSEAVNKLKLDASKKMNYDEVSSQYKNDDKFLISYYKVLEEFNQSFTIFKQDITNSRINVVNDFINSLNDSEKENYNEVFQEKSKKIIANNEDNINMRNESDKYYLIHEIAMNEYLENLEYDETMDTESDDDERLVVKD